MPKTTVRASRIYGLTGGIASGKSLVGSFFRDYGIPLIDADQIARSLRSPGGLAEKAILAQLGTIDPKELRDRISQDPDAKKQLESILHPLIQKESEALFQFWKDRGAPYLVYEATLLIEAGRAKDCDGGVILVEAHDEIRVERLITRDGMTEKNSRRFLDAQSAGLAHASIRENAATHRIRNEDSIEALRFSTRLLHLEFLARAQRER